MKKNIIFILIFVITFTLSFLGCKNHVNHSSPVSQEILPTTQNTQAEGAKGKDETQALEATTMENTQETEFAGTSWESKIGDKVVTLGFISTDEVSVNNNGEMFPSASYTATKDTVTITFDNKNYTLTLSSDKQTLKGSFESGVDITLNRVKE